MKRDDDSGADEKAQSGGGAVLGKPLSILIVTDIFFPDTPGGGNRMVYYASRGLAEAGHRVRVVTHRPRPGLPPQEHIGRLDVRRYDLGFSERRGALWEAFGAIRTVRRACDELAREAPVDVVSVHQPLPGFAATLSPALRDVPFSYAFYSPWHEEYDFRVQASRNPCLRSIGWYGLNSRARRLLEGRTLRRCRNVILLSEFSRTQIERIHRYPREGIFLIPGPVDESRYVPMEDRPAVRRRLGLPAEGTILLTVRNLRRRMGLASLIDAMGRVVREAPSAFLVIGGKGPLREALEERARRLGLEGRVRFTGYLDEEDLPACYNAADFFVLPTEVLEGFGMVTLEALACGTPVLGTPVGATPELLRPLGESFLFADASPEAMAEAIVRHVRRLEADPAGYRALRERCARYVRERFTWGQMVSRWDAALRAAAKTG
ncbi:MAG: glycosyltransferase family 4 protein [Nitrospinota bacterium]